MDGYETEQLGIVINHLADATQRRLKAQTVWDKVRRQQGKPPEAIISLPEISGHPQIQDLRIALIQTRRNLSEAAKHYGPKHPKYLQAQAQLQVVNGQIGQVLGNCLTAYASSIRLRWTMSSTIRRCSTTRKPAFRR